MHWDSRSRTKPLGSTRAGAAGDEIAIGSGAGTEGPAAGRDVLVVDAGIHDPAILINGRHPGVEVVRLEPGGRGLEQIAGQLAGRRGISSLHLLCRGEPGALVLAGERIDLPALAMRPAVLTGIAAALEPGAVVALYGCSVASGAAGLKFLDYLEAVLGVSVAASAGLVGAPALGGRWTLRDRHGMAVETAFTTLSRASYRALFAAGH